MQVKKQVVVDVREPSEYEDGHIDGAINIPSGEFLNEEVVHKLFYKYKDSEIVLYCRSGARAGRCEDVLRKHGFENVKNGINQQTVQHLLAGNL